MRSIAIFFAVTSLLVGLAYGWECTGASYVDVEYDPSGDCSDIQTHISRSYDAVTQTTSTTYYGNNFKTLYVSEQLANTFDLYDYNQGVSYHYEDGTCTFYSIRSGEFSVFQLLTMAIVDWDVEDFNGIPSRAYTTYDNNITTRGLMRWDCMESSTFLQIEDEVKQSAFHSNFLNVGVQDCIDNALANAQAMLDAVTCESLD